MKRLFFSLFSLFLVLQLSAHDDDKSAGHFIPNQGQWESHIDYKVRMKAMDVYLEDAVWTFNLFDIDKFEVLHHRKVEGKESPNEKIDAFAYKVRFIGADFSQVSTDEKTSFYYNYFQGKDRSTWKSKVYGFGEVYYSNVWKNIDLKVYFDEKDNIKYDFILHPGADYRDIQLEYIGAECQSLVNGNIEVSASLFDIVEQAPFSYVMNSGKEIKSQYKLEGNRLSFDLGEFPRNERIVIDPTLIASTASGSTASCYGHSATYDYNDNIYTGAICFGVGYPASTGAYQITFGTGGTDIAVSKLNSDGTSLLWASYLGGSAGDYPHSLICNEDNELIVYGTTNSTDFPVNGDAFQTAYGGGNSDITVSKFSDNGTSLIGSTYLGGSDDDGRLTSWTVSMYGHDNYKGEVYCNAAGEIYISSSTSSTDYPITPTAYMTSSQGGGDAVVTILNANLTSTVASTYFGGSLAELGLGIKIKSNNEVVISGNTESTDLPASADAYQTSGSSTSIDGYVAVLSSDLSSLSSCTYLSTADDDGAYFVQLSSSDEVYILGGSSGGNFPTSTGVYSNDAGKTFIAKLDEDLTSMPLSTVVDSSGFTGGELAAFLVDECGKIYYSCYGSQFLKGTADAEYTSAIGPGGFAEYTFYVGVMDAGLGDLLYGTFYTGNHVDGGTSRFDSRGAIYQAVCHTAGFNIMPGAWANNATGGYDVNVFKIDVELFGADVRIDPDMDTVVCLGDSVYFSQILGGADDFIWNFGDGISSTDELPVHFYDTPGNYMVTLVGETAGGVCKPDTDAVMIRIIDVEADFAYDRKIICPEQTVEFSNLSTSVNANSIEYQWDFGDGTGTSNQENPQYSYSQVGTYDVTLTISDAESVCENVKVVELAIEVVEEVAEFESEIELCLGDINYFQDLTTYPELYGWGDIVEWDWNFGDGNSSSEQNPEHIYEEGGVYSVELVAHTEEGCELRMVKSNYITVHDVQADFSMNMDVMYPPYETPFLATDASSGHQNMEWFIDGNYFGNGAYLSADFPSLSEDEEIYEIKLIATNAMCSDTIIKNLKVIPEHKIYIPNIFTPNGDGLNEGFKPLGRMVEMSHSYSFKIFNRWGEELFTTNDKDLAWFGFDKDGEEVQANSYVWKVEVKSEFGYYSGHGWVVISR
jgi:gliding motility-associated-like protein